MFEGSSAKGAELAYHRAADRLLNELLKSGQIHCAKLRQRSVRRKDKKIVAAEYEYQVDNGGAWGEIRFDLTERTAWVEAFAENDPCGTWTVTDQVIRAILMCENEKLPKKY